MSITSILKYRSPSATLAMSMKPEPPGLFHAQDILSATFSNIEPVPGRPSRVENTGTLCLESSGVKLKVISLSATSERMSILGLDEFSQKKGAFSGVINLL